MAMTYVGWGQVEHILYYNGFEDLPFFEGQIPTQDSVEVNIVTSYDAVDWGHWSPRLNVTANRFEVQSSIYEYNLIHSLGLYNVSEYDSVLVSVDSRCSDGYFSVLLVINQEDTVNYLTRSEPPIYSSYNSCNYGGWSLCSNTLDLIGTNITNAEFLLKLNFSTYHPSWQAYQYAVNYRIDDLTIVGYSSITETEEILCQSDLDGDGGVGTMDLIILLAGYGLTCE